LPIATRIKIAATTTMPVIIIVLFIIYNLYFKHILDLAPKNRDPVDQ